MTELLTVKPRDLQVGDLLPRLSDDLSIDLVAIESVEPVKTARAGTRYRVRYADGAVQWFHPNTAVQVTR